MDAPSGLEPSAGTVPHRPRAPPLPMSRGIRTTREAAIGAAVGEVGEVGPQEQVQGSLVVITEDFYRPPILGLVGWCTGWGLSISCDKAPVFGG